MKAVISILLSFNIAGALAFSDTSMYASDDTPTARTGVQCTGAESALLSCPMSSSQIEECYSNQFGDAGVICSEGCCQY